LNSQAIDDDETTSIVHEARVSARDGTMTMAHM
jgi:hypothetical protein